jgi:hypothetical protein
MVIKARKGQAMMELAVGMFSFALVASALCGFAVCIVRSLRMQNSLRVGNSSQSETVEMSGFAAKYVFGTDSFKLKERVVMPQTTILK